jgi:hypothetical protein
VCSVGVARLVSERMVFCADKYRTNLATHMFHLSIWARKEILFNINLSLPFKSKAGFSDYIASAKWYYYYVNGSVAA